ncbi:MAG: methyltransferase domain-containing protein [Chitinophagaceae bacterium]
MPWNPDVYNKFKTERYAPFYDLLGLVTVKKGLSVADLGCGIGELARKLADTLPESQVTGVDASAEMLAKAAVFADERLHFIQQSVEDTIEQGNKYDLVFSNAAMQWIGDHVKLFPRLISLVKEGGQLAVQVPSNDDNISHVAIRQLATQEPYRTALKGWIRTSPVLPIEQYAQLLFANGGHDITVFEKVYPHILENAAAVAQWTSGSTQVPYMEKLPEELRESFAKDYLALLENAMPGSPVLYTFKRKLIVASF